MFEKTDENNKKILKNISKDFSLTFSLKILILVSVFLLFLILNKQLAFAQSESPNQTKEDAIKCLNESKRIMERLISLNFSVQRINDSLRKAEDIYIAQLEKEKKGTADFSLVIDYCKKIKEIKKNALLARDEFESLLKFYNETVSQDINSTEILKLFDQIKKEIVNERYENALEMIKNAYDRIEKIEAEYSTLKVYYRATANVIRLFIEDNWIYIVSVCLLLAIIILIFHKQIAKARIRREIKKLNLRKNILKDLIKKTQREYFEEGKISESTYKIRIKKFGTMINDIDRKIPLLIEELAKLEKKKDKIKVKTSKEKSKEGRGKIKTRESRRRND